MKVKNEELAKHGTNNTKQQQETVATHDYKRQRAADVEDSEAQARKQAQKQAKKQEKSDGGSDG